MPKWGTLLPARDPKLEVAFLKQHPPDKVVRLVNPVALDIGECGKIHMLTLKHLGKDGKVFERRRVLLRYYLYYGLDDMLIMMQYEAWNP